VTGDPRELDPPADVLFVPNVDEAVSFYTETFGFKLQRRDPPAGDWATFAIVRLGAAMVMLMQDAFYAGPRRELDTRGAGLDIRVMVDDVDALYTRARAAGLPIMHELGDRDYGLRDFIVRDPNGFRLRFASPLA
jgi:uncharacterized glyoxalase superfamily protein PhnB